MNNSKTNVYIETYGCQMNNYDSELVISILKKNNLDITQDIYSANVALLNTCSVRENANNKVLNRIHELKKFNHGMVIGILGCMATNFKEKLLENNRLKIDLIAGPDSYQSLPKLIKEALDETTLEKPFDVTLSEFETYDQIPANRTKGANAWIAIMRGCNNFCTFCVVPYTRGRERSRSVSSVIDEVNQLIDQGFKQVTLLGQNVNSYRYGDDSFIDLLDEISSKTAIERIRFTSPHPKDFPIPLLQLINERNNICKQIHVPLQSGNDRILKKMNRTYTRNEFLDLIEEIRTAIPNVALSTDIIVGFPTESEDEFLDTKSLCETVKFDHAFIFKYSERPNTRAALKFPDNVTQKEKKDRIVSLVNMQKIHSKEKNTRWVNKTQNVLIERIENDQFIGRNDANVLVYTTINTPVKVGEIVPINIKSASPHGLKGAHQT